MRSLLLAGLVTLMVSPALSAPQSAQGREALKRNCSTDAVTFCSDTDPGSRAMNACFKKHMRELSEGCRRAIRQHGGSRR